MSVRESYSPGAAGNARIEKEGDEWTLVIERQLNHPPARVWQALTDPIELHEWAPFDADRNLGSEGSRVKLSTVGAPQPYVTETTVGRAEASRLLEYSWGGGNLRWELEQSASGTRLRLWHNIDRRYIAMGAAGWHICFDVLDHFLSGQSIGRIVAGDALKFEGWQRLNREYSEQFGVAVETPGWG